MEDKKNDYQYFLLHATKNFDNLRSILLDGYIYQGKDVDPSKRFYYGDKLESTTASDYVYTSINFTDINNISQTKQVCLLLDPIVLKKYGGSFSVGWSYIPNKVIIDRNDILYDKKIGEIKEIVSNIDEYLPAKLQSIPFMTNEITINNKISTKYVIGIICYTVDQKEIEELRRLTGNKIPIYNTNNTREINMPIYHNT